MTNDRVRDEIGQIELVPREERVFGPGSGPIMAAFTHLNPRRQPLLRRQLRRVLRRARPRHRGRRDRATTTRASSPPPAKAPMHLPMRLYHVAIDARLHDLRAAGAVDAGGVRCLDDYAASRALGRRAARGGSAGVVYRSVRHASGQCVGLFKPRGAQRTACRRRTCSTPGTARASPTSTRSSNGRDRSRALRPPRRVARRRHRLDGAFHFCFDLNHFGSHPRAELLPRSVLDRAAHRASSRCSCSAPGWARRWRWTHGQSWPRFWRRWAQVAAARVLVSVGSCADVPAQLDQLRRAARHRADADRRCASAAPLRRAGCGRSALAGDRAAAAVVQHPFFDTRLDQLGRPGDAQAGHRGLRAAAALARRDAVGAGGWAQWLLAHRRGVLAGALPRALRPLAVLGRWSLSFYMLHQPVLIGADRAGGRAAG